MAEAEATIPENTEVAQETPEVSQEPVPKAPEPEAKRGRGRPAGAKDKEKRVTKPKVRVEPIPQATPVVANPPQPKPSEPQIEPPIQERSRPEPPSPRTLYRQTSAHLLHLRGVLNSQKRASVADRYTSRLHDWHV